MTIKEFQSLQEKYNKPRDPKQQKKYQEYEEKIREIMKKPPNDQKQHYLKIGINELTGGGVMNSKGYFYDSDEQKWCLYSVTSDERTYEIYFNIIEKNETEEEAFQSLYEWLEENIKRYEWDLEREKNDRMTKKEFLEWFGQDNRKSRLEEKGPYRILWDREPGEERYAVGYYKRNDSLYFQEMYGTRWVAYAIVNGENMSCPYKHETRAIYMMRYWIEMILDGRLKPRENIIEEKGSHMKHKIMQQIYWQMRDMMWRCWKRCRRK